MIAPLTPVAPVAPAAPRPAPGGDAAAVARDFEAIIMRQLIATMRAGSTGDPLLGSDAQTQFREMFDARVADQLAATGGGLGIGRMLARQLGGE